MLLLMRNHPLSEAIERTKPTLTDAKLSTKQRVRLLWSAAKQARDLDAPDVVHSSFMALAVEVNLIDRNGWWGRDVRDERRSYGRVDVSHVIKWAQRGWNPFERDATQLKRSDGAG
jgi:hypothetical protein